MAAPASRAALWIKPTGAARLPCRDACEQARARFGGPRFEPHITLLGGIELTEEEGERRLKQLAARLQPFTVRLQQARLGTSFFQRLFVAVELSPELQDARALAEALFEGAEAAFVPHLSLVYGDQALADDATQGFEALNGLGFEVESIHLVRTGPDLPPEQWRAIAEHTLRPVSGTE